MTSQSSFNIATGATISEAYLDGITQHLPTTETATPSTVFEGKLYVRTDLDALYISDGSTEREISRYGAATTFTISSVTQSVSPSFTTTRAVYVRQGRWITGEAVIAMTASGSSGYGIAVNTTGLPTPATNSGLAAGTFIYTDAGTAVYVGAVTMSGTTFNFWCHNTGYSLGGAPAFAIQNTDSLWFSFSYEATS